MTFKNRQIESMATEIKTGSSGEWDIKIFHVLYVLPLDWSSNYADIYNIKIRWVIHLKSIYYWPLNSMGLKLWVHLYMDFFFFFFNRKFYITRWSEAGSIMDSEPWIWRNRGYRGLALRLYTDFPRCWGLNNAQPLPALFKRRLWFLGRSPFGLWKETLDSGRRPTGEISQKSISFLLLCLATFLVRGDEEASWLISGYDTIFRFSTNCS